MDVVKNIQDACEELGQVDLSGVLLESADPKLLNPAWGDLDEHVSMQPSAIAYYGALLKEAKRALASYEKSYERWQKVKFLEAKAAAAASSTNKVLVAEIEGRYLVDNKEEIEKWESQIGVMQANVDTLDVWYEAWRQKSFSITAHVSVTEDERWNSSPSMDGPVIEEAVPVKKPGKKVLPEEKIDRVRRIMKERREI
jgi:hypothetical protein